VERAQPGGSTTKVSFARVSAYQQPTRTRFELSYAGMVEHARLAAQFESPLWYHPSGSLAWCDGGNDGSSSSSFVRHVDQLKDWGYRVAWYEAAHVQMWEPGIVFPHQSAPVALFPEEGWVDAPQLVHSLIEAATDLGNLTFWQDTALAIETHAGRVTAVRLASGKRIKIDGIVNAAGPDAATVAATFGIPLLTGALTTRRSLVVDLVTNGNPLCHVLRAPEIHIRPAGSGRVRVRSDQVDSHLQSETSSDLDSEVVADLLQRAYRTMPILASSAIEQVQIGTALFPADGHPSAGALSAVSGYYEALANSGITLGPLLGRLLAEQIVTGEVHPFLLHCSPDRFLYEEEGTYDHHLS
jgi:glycine/D-amino acid oxidase-like deaminating enzyme